MSKLQDQDEGRKKRGRKLSDGGARAKFYHEVCDAHLARIEFELAVFLLDTAVQIEIGFFTHWLTNVRKITLIDQLDDLLKQQRKAIIHEAVTGKIDLSAASLGKVET